MLEWAATSPGDKHGPGVELVSPAWAGGGFTTTLETRVSSPLSGENRPSRSPLVPSSVTCPLALQSPFHFVSLATSENLNLRI